MPTNNRKVPTNNCSPTHFIHQTRIFELFTKNATMKNIKPFIAADILILLALVLGINGRLMANHYPIAATPQQDRQTLVATFQPYIKSIAWVNESLNGLSLGHQLGYSKDRFLMLILILLGLGTYFYYRNRMKKLQRAQFRTHLALNGLRAQLNPHFLFNSLASIQDLVNEDNKVAANRYFAEIARLLRYVVDSSKYAYMPLVQELEALEKYCSLEALRTPFQYSFDISKDIDQNNTEIPTMLLQPFVENAILHGLRPGTDPKELRIRLWPESGNRIGVMVEDNGIGIEEGQRRGQKLQDTREHQGLANTQQRIDLLNEVKKEKITLQISDRSHPKPGQTGTLVQLSIPLYGFDPHDGTETARTPWLHGDDLIRSIRAPLPKAAGLVDLSRVTSFLNDV